MTWDVLTFVGFTLLAVPGAVFGFISDDRRARAERRRSR